MTESRMRSDSQEDAVPGTTIRFFLSSTFADLQVERDVLQRRVFPQLRQMCAEAGLRLLPIDLRWGISEAAGTDRQTLQICFDELERCRQLSPDFFLVIQLGERYGSHFLPTQISAHLVEQLLSRLSPEERAAFDAAYHCDENAVPPEYVLLRGEGPHDPADEALRLALVRAGQAVGLGEADQLLFEGSATHREIQLGLLGQPPGTGQEAGVLCAVRAFVGDRVGPAAERFAAQSPEHAATMRQLTEAVLARLPEENVRHYEVLWDGNRGPAFDEDAVAQVYLSLLRPKVEAVIAARTTARAAAAQHGRDQAAVANTTFEGEQLAHFVEREEVLAAIDAYLAAPAAIPLVLAGPGGAGKSTLLAHVAEEIRRERPGALTLVRYVGVTPGTETVPTLLDRLCAALAAAYGRAFEPAPEDAARAFREALGWATTERPLVLVLDALDQLGAGPVALDWLPEELPPQVHLLVSLLDEPDRPELARLQARQRAPQVIRLDRMNAAEGNALLSRWLAAAGRTLRPAQRAVVLAAFTSEGRPLYLRLAFDEARRWRSFDAVDTLPALDPTIPGLLANRFRSLERRDAHGPLFTSHTLGLLRAARNGLAEDELLTLLARDTAVRWDLQRSSPSSPPIDPKLPLPAALWARLYAELGPYLTERDADGAHLLTPYHRQFADVADARYLRGIKGRARHRALARYFAAQQILEGGHVNRPNLRKLSEQPIQEAAGELFEALHTTLTNVTFLEQKIAYQGTFGILDDLALAPEVDITLRDIAAALRLGAHVLDDKADQAESQLWARVPDSARAQLHDPPDRPRLRLDSRSLTEVGGSLIRTFGGGHTDSVLACAFSPDGGLALSASRDKTLHLWEVATGRSVRQFKGHTKEVLACAFSADGHLILSASADKTLRLWDVASGETRRTFTGHTGEVQGCAFSPGGALAVSCAADSTLRLWDVVTGRTMRRFKGHTSNVESCTFSPDGTLVLSGSWDGTLRLWEVATGRSVRQFEVGRNNRVLACAFSPDGQLILSACEGKLLLWDTITGRELRHFAVPADAGVSDCSFSPDGTLALSASWDCMQLWEVATGIEVRRFAARTNDCPFSPNGALVLTTAKDTLQLWKVAGDSEVRHLEGGLSLESFLEPHLATESDEKIAYALSPDWRLALTGTRDGTLELWEVASGRKVGGFHRHTKVVTVCSFSPDGTLVVSGSADKTVWVWEVETGLPVTRLRVPMAWVWDCAFHPSGKLVLSTSGDELSIDQSVRLSEIESGRDVRQFETRSGGALQCAFSPDGKIAFTAGRNILQQWDVATERELGHYEGRYSIALGAFSPDGKFALTACDYKLRLWEVATGHEARPLQGTIDVGLLLSCAFSRDGRLFVTATFKTLRLWEAASRREIAQWVHDTQLKYCAFSPDGARVVVGDTGGTFHFLTILGMHAESIPNSGHRQLSIIQATSTWSTPTEQSRRRVWWKFWQRDTTG